MASVRTVITLAVVVAAMVGTTALTGPTSASAEAHQPEPAGTTESILDLIPAPTLDRMVAQAPLVDAANVIRTAVDRAPGRGYAGIGLVDDQVTLWWKGEPPADIAAAVAAARRTAPVEVADATYSRAELRTAAARIAPVVEADPTDASHSVRLRTDGTGIEIGVDYSSSTELPTLPETGVRTTFVERDQMVERSRTDDDAPFDGGAGIGPAGPWCTAGFGVRDADTTAGYILTAEHCGSIGSVWHTGWDTTTGTGTLIGYAVDSNDDHDTMIISTSAPGDHIYVGGQHDEVRAEVVGWTEVFPGQLLCQSGYTSAGVLGGPICNLRVDYHYTDIEDLVEATQLDGHDSARGGDSGGPVYFVNPDGTVLAAGTTTRSAGPGFGFQDFATARDDYGNLVPATAIASSCRVSFVVTDSWGTGYTASVTVYNDGPAVNGWSVGWTFPGGQLLQGHWNGVFQQTGSAVTVTNESHNAAIPTGGAVNFGYTADGSPATPTPFTLNGTTCN
ncbi:cellulose binding domain-containing protein [Solwaraspora sp. WMMA2080]|uniref:cellulose binding domain-containing protein n=1 Tax=unclassified Solwaraspora TaxID=2627926 RepID=UPI00248BD45C|nr:MULTISPECIES: cellulose binding domain-containing protein [unclassified Solwaraspora]WBB94914.1 cellulose binding domain-containing protein [Solwaraspora sp. WMMA2059]WBC21203.1 cellulose binding domain-containing protein [Solwaraspora sp. WMMA2080]